MTWFARLTKSEKSLIKYGGIVIGLALFWAFIYQPVNKSIEVKQQQVVTLQKQYNEMQASEELLKKQKINEAKFRRDNNKPFISWVDEELEKQQLSDFITRAEPKNNQTYILSFENVAFDKLATWLQNIEQNYHINITEADINLTDRSNGLCNARLTLQE